MAHRLAAATEVAGVRRGMASGRAGMGGERAEVRPRRAWAVSELTCGGGERDDVRLRRRGRLGHIPGSRRRQMRTFSFSTNRFFVGTRLIELRVHYQKV